MEKVNKFLDKFWPVLLIIFLAPVSWALLIPGFYGASDELHIAWLFEMDKTLKAGQLPPRFVPDLSFGFGYPLFNFVFPLPFYLGEIIHLIGLSFVDSIKAVFLLSFIFSFITMYFLLKKFTCSLLAFTGAIIYIYTPYRAVDTYIRGAIGEIVAFIFLPLIILSIINITEDKNDNPKKKLISWVGVGSLSIAGLILSHNITTYMFVPLVFILGLIRVFIPGPFKRSRFLQLCAMVAMGLLSSIYFWLPALLDSKLMKYDTVFNFADHFPTIKQLIIPYWGYGASVPGPFDNLSFNIGLTNLLLMFICAVTLIIFRKRFKLGEKSLLIWAFFSFAISVFMMNFRSTFIWQNIPLLTYFQFPWRFLIITTFLVPIFLIGIEKLKYKYLLSLLLMTLTIILNFSIFRPQDFLGRRDDYYISRYIPTPIASPLYFTQNEEYLRLPATAQKRPDMNYPKIFPVYPEMKSIIEYNDLNSSVEISSSRELLLNYNKYFFPGWQAKLDGKRLAMFAGVPFGQISMLVPPGEHNLKISFTETTFKKFLDLISLLTIFLSAVFILKYEKHYSK